MRESVEERRAEFDAHVWDHAVDPFQADFDARPPLTQDDQQALLEVVKCIRDGGSDPGVAEVIKRELRRNRELIFTFLQIAGLTRNKILTDLRATRGVGRSTLRVPSSPDGLHLHPDTWAVAGTYLASRLRKVLEPLSHVEGQLDGILEAINQATWPGWIRQERAKRQGHEAESRLAKILVAVSIPFVPPGKADNPLSGDVQLHEVSFDLVVPDLVYPLVCVKATVHTANIGQYGESKDALEMREARQTLIEHYGQETAPSLLALIDGIGFRSNRAGLLGVLTEADEFCQFRTIWKGAVVSAARLDRRIVLGLPKEEIEFHVSFLRRYEKAVVVCELDEAHVVGHQGKLMPAGDGVILLK